VEVNISLAGQTLSDIGVRRALRDRPSYSRGKSNDSMADPDHPLPRNDKSSEGARRHTRASLTPESWIGAATELLVLNGIDAVRVDVIAKILNVTRGSFYWHFKDREDLLRHVLESWRKATTEQIIERFDTHRGNPEQLFRELISLPHRGRSAARAAAIELAIRAWARRDQMARYAVDQVDSRRLSYIAQCFSALGFPMAEAQERAFVLYAYEVSESILFNQGNAAQKRARATLIERLLLKRIDPPSRPLSATQTGRRRKEPSTRERSKSPRVND
jgi:AcrR family transcriptional regulator